MKPQKKIGKNKSEKSLPQNPNPLSSLSLRVIAMPTDTNPNGDMFGGWMMSMMDLAGASHAIRIANGPVVTVAVDAMTFHAPAYVGDEISCYTIIEKIGNTSIRVKIESYARRNRMNGENIRITEGSYTYVAIGSNRKPKTIKK